MKKYLFLFLVTLLCICLLSCYEPDDIYDPFQSEVDIAPTEDSKSHTDNSPFITQVNEYSSAGDLLREIYYAKDYTGNVSEYKRYEYVYDLNGNLSSIINYSPDDKEGTTYKSFQYNNENQQTSYYLYGQLRTEWNYDDVGNLLHQYTYNSSGELTDSKEYIYTDNVLSSISSMSKEITEYEDMNGVIHTEVHSIYTLEEFDDRGEPVKITYYESGCEPYYEVITYLERQYICTTYSFTNTIDSILTIDHDEMGRRTKYELKDFDGSILILRTYEYSENTETVFDYNEDGSISEISKVEYDQAGRTVFEASYDSQWNLCYSWEYEYDSQGYLLRITITHEDGTIEEQIGPDREFNTDDILVRETFYSNVNYIGKAYLGVFP